MNASPSYRDQWFPRLTADEQAAVLDLERQIAAAQAALTALRQARRKWVNKGVGRARWTLIGRDAYWRRAA